MGTSIRVAHLTSVHSRGDTRIFHKQCKSLADAGYGVCLFVADGMGADRQAGVDIIDIGRPSSRFRRMLNVPRKLFAEVMRDDFALVHLHDPELIPIGLKLKRFGKKVVFDAHEDLPRQMLGKHYLNRPMRTLLSIATDWYESAICGKFDAIVAATPHIRQKFEKINRTTIDVNNYPILGELTTTNQTDRDDSSVCYLGGLAKIRGIDEIVRAMELLQHEAVLLLAGAFVDSDTEARVTARAGWQKVDYLGWLDRDGVRDVLHRSCAGLVTLHPLVNYLDSLPVKMFEYMAAGLPVIASNFPLWQKIVGENDCGICVNPLEPREIAAAIDRLLGDPDESRRMGSNGLRAVRERYNWSFEEKKLLTLYDEILSA